MQPEAVKFSANRNFTSWCAILFFDMDKMLKKTEKCLSAVMAKLLIGYVLLPQKKLTNQMVKTGLLYSICLLAVLCLLCPVFTTDSYASNSSKKNAETPMFQLEPFILNVGSRFLKLSINLELSSSTATKKAKVKTGAIRDAIIMLVTSKMPDEISSFGGKQQLKDELLTKLNGILGEGNVKNIYFTDFVMQ